MTVQCSIHKMVSDGTLSTVVLGIQYLQRNDIYVRIAGDETPQSGAVSGYTWSFINNTTLKILPVVPNGVEVVVYRRTDVDAMYNIYSQNAQFDEATIDENNQQLLYIAQEYLEQGIPGAGIAALKYINTVGGMNYYRFVLTDGAYTPPFGVPDGTIALRSELSGVTGASNIGECPDVSVLRGTLGSAGTKLVLSSYNSGWASMLTPPVGGGKFRWVEDNTLTDDGVFIFKPTGATGAWIRQYQKKVTPYLAGAKGDNVGDTDAILRCFSVAADKRLNVHIDKGQYKYTQTPTVGPECNVTGEFSVAELLPVGCDGFKFTSSDAVGGRKFGGFVLLGTGANQAGYTAIKVDPGQDVLKRTTGVSFEDIQVFNFKTFCDAKNLWHSTFRSCNGTNICNGIIFRGRCVSNEVGSGTKLIRGNGALVSGECIGVQYIESTDYTPSVYARPEGCTITASVLVFGFDVLVDVDSMLAGGIYGADLDYGRSRGVRYRYWDGNPTIAPNWIAGDAGFSAQPFIGVEARPVGTQRTTGPSIDHITMNTFNGNPGDCGVRIGSLNGRARISKCLISNQAGAGVYLDGGRFNTLFDCQIDSPDPLFMFSSGGNQIAGNTLSGGPISNIAPTAKNMWGKNQGEFCTEDTVEVPIAAGQLSGTLNLASIGYTRGVPLAAGLVSLTCSSTGTTDPGSLYASISPDGMTITAYKTIAAGVPSSLFVRIQLAS